jgi:RNA polymerase sigma factor (sigma-70 family)
MTVCTNDFGVCKKIVEKAIFEHCYRRYYKRILTYCHAFYGLSSLVEDTVQDAFLAFWRRGIKHVNLVVNPEWYIRAIARNICCHIQKVRRHDSFNEDVHSERDPYLAGRGFYELISSLSKEEQQIVELRYLYGYNCLETARQVRISRRTCCRRLKTAKQKLLHGCQAAR